MENYWVKGGSSLLFIIPFIKSLYCSKILAWKASIFILTAMSFLCNANDNKQPYLFLDYFAIFLTTISYVNRMELNILFYLLIIYEYKKYNSIERTKNISFVFTVIRSFINTYYYVGNSYYYVLVISSVTGTVIYKIRYNLYDKQYYRRLTYLFHVCIMNILYITSITACDDESLKYIYATKEIKHEL